MTHSPYYFAMFYVYYTMLILSLSLYGTSGSIIKPSCSGITADSQQGQFRSCNLCLLTSAFRRRELYIFHYKRKYMFRRIPYASNGSFNPYIITNKEAYMVNGNPAGSKESNGHKLTSPNKPQFQKCFTKELSEPLCSSNLPAVQMHFKNYCLDVPGKFSFAIEFNTLLCEKQRNQYTLCVMFQNLQNTKVVFHTFHRKKIISPRWHLPRGTSSYTVRGAIVRIRP